MSGPHAATADAVMSNIRGCRDAQLLVERLRQGCAPQDALLEETLRQEGTLDDNRIRGFFRELQKAVERSGPAS